MPVIPYLLMTLRFRQENSAYIYYRNGTLVVCTHCERQRHPRRVATAGMTGLATSPRHALKPGEILWHSKAQLGRLTAPTELWISSHEMPELIAYILTRLYLLSTAQRQVCVCFGFVIAVCVVDDLFWCKQLHLSLYFFCGSETCF